MSAAEIEEGRSYDEVEKRIYYSRPAQREDGDFWSWLTSWFR
jgi:hypothetical protein